MHDDLYRQTLEDIKENVDRWTTILQQYGRSNDPAWRCVYQVREVLKQELRMLSSVSSHVA